MTGQEFCRQDWLRPRRHRHRPLWGRLVLHHGLTGALLRWVVWHFIR